MIHWKFSRTHTVVNFHVHSLLCGFNREFTHKINKKQKYLYFIGFVCDFIDFLCEFTVKTTEHTVTSYESSDFT
jgi:hypothetical protein